MNKLRRLFAIYCCKALIFAGKLMGKKGSSTPGGIALKLYPNILRDLAHQVQHETIFVCGTNGKTTTNNLLYALLSHDGSKVVCNTVGANMLAGVTCAYINACSLSGKLYADYAAIECDEASLRHIAKHVQPDRLVITNLFRDQLDRYGEIDITIRLLNEALDKLPDTTLVLNGDDPLCVQFGQGRKAIYYGIDEDCNVSVNETKEGQFCLQCGAPLQYQYYHYSQLGHYACTKCGFRRPAPDYSARDINLDGKLAFTIYYGGKTYPLDLNYRGFYNIYNVLASFAAYKSLGLPTDGLDAVFHAYRPQIGRMEAFTIAGKQVIFNLSKNPAGFNQAIATLVSDRRKKDVMVVINDNAQDGIDVSWLWDVDFDRLHDANIGRLTASGIRKYDIGLRLKYAGFDHIKTVSRSRASLLDAIQGPGEVCYVLVNYTALFSTQDDLKALEKGER